MKIGIVCPYSFDVPGGVQFHVRDLAGELQRLNHEVSVLAPADEDTPVPAFVTPAGRSVPVHYNGSVARLSFGPRINARVRRWLSEGQFDVLHIHEPVTPSVGMLALWAADCPIAATFHSSQESSLALHLAEPLVRSSVEKITARIAVSEEARRTLVDHLGGDAVVVPNGVYVASFEEAQPKAAWQGSEQAPTIAFLGRADEPRKGLGILLDAIGPVVAEFPGARFLIAGRGEIAEQIASLGSLASHVEALGPLSEEDKASLFASADVFVAPQTGGESFGIVLVEAMSAGCAVVASNLRSFSDVLDGGALGLLFESGDSAGAAAAIVQTLRDHEATKARRKAASRAVARYDWSQVARRIVAVYEMIVPMEGDQGPRRRRWRDEEAGNGRPENGGLRRGRRREKDPEA